MCNDQFHSSHSKWRCPNNKLKTKWQQIKDKEGSMQRIDSVLLH